MEGEMEEDEMDAESPEPSEDPEIEFSLEELEEAEGPEEPEEPRFFLNEDEPNLVAELEETETGRAFLADVVSTALEAFDEAWDSSEEYRKKAAESLAMFYGEAKRKGTPFENCASAHLPLMMQNVMRYNNKIVGEVFGDWSETVRFTALDNAQSDVAKLASQHTNWQMSRAIPGFKRQMHRAVNVFTILGDVVCHSYRDLATGTNRHDILTSDDFVVPWTHVSVTDDFSDLPWVARVLRMHRHEVRRLARVWANTDKLLEDDPNESDLEAAFRTSVAERVGESEPSDGLTVYEIVHWEGYVEVPGHERDRYCQLVFDRARKLALSFRIHEQVESRDEARHQYEMSQLQAYEQAVQQRQSQLEARSSAEQRAAELAPLAEAGDPEAQTAFLEVEAQLHAPLPPEPELPGWMEFPGEQPREPEKKPIHMFSHGVCMEPLLGVLGVGIGRIESDLNRAGNTVLNQFLDAATLGNGKSFVSSGPVRFPEPFRVEPGRINRAVGVTGDIRQYLMPLEFGGANEQLIQALQIFMKAGEDAGSTPDVLSGSPGKSGETARGIQLRAEQAHSMLSVPAHRFGDFVLQVVRNNNRLNAHFMTDAEVFFPNRSTTLGAAAPPRQKLEATRAMYDNEFELELVRDLQFKSRGQRVAEADELVGLAKAFPPIAENQAYMHAAVTGALIARGRRDMAELLGEPPQRGPGPYGTTPPPPPPAPPAPAPGGVPQPGPTGGAK